MLSAQRSSFGGVLASMAWGALLTACGTDSVLVYGVEEGPHVTPLPDSVQPAVPPLEPPDLSGTDAEWVFEEAAVREYQLSLAPEAWQALKASALSEQYFPAELSVDGAPFGRVGLRFKGSRGTLGRCADARGNLLCEKLSMKIKFDEYEDSQRFFGLKRLNFNSMLSDSSRLHEQLAYRLFREMGVAAPRAAHARLDVNGESLGLFSLVEQIDGRFTDDRFAGGDGNLYKEQWIVTSDAAALDGRLETNEEAPDHRVMIQFHEELAAAAPEARPDVLARFMDVDELMAYLAVDRVVTNWDGPTAFYCPGRRCNNHNYFIYQHEHEPRFSLIPWDLDNTFRVATPFQHVPLPFQVPEQCPARFPMFGSVGAMAPACDPVFAALALSDRARYRAQVERLLAGPFDLGRLDAWLDERVEQLSPYVAEDDHGASLTEFQTAVELLRGDLPYLAQRVVAEQEGESLPRFRLHSDSLNDFEATTPLGLQFGVVWQRDVENSVAVGLDEAGAVRGQRGLTLFFELAANAKPSRSWVRVSLPFAGDVVDLSGKSRLRLLVASDAPRTLRIGIDSAVYTRPESHAVFGWDVAVDETPRVVELSLAAAGYPAAGPEVPETLADVLESASALLLEPRAVERLDRGRHAAHARDPGWIRLDHIELLP